MAHYKPKTAPRPAGDHLQFDVVRMLKLRGVKNYATFLNTAGISYNTALAMVAGRYGSIKWKQMEQLCLALNCTPNDLFRWQGDGSDLPPNSELRKLVRPEKNLNVTEWLNTLSADEAAKIIGG